MMQQASVPSTSLQNRQMRALLSLSEFEDTDTVLDVGCGSGIVARQLSPHVKRIVGIDKSSKQIDIALRNNSTTNTEYIVLDAEKFGYYRQIWRETFDKVMCSAVLHWCQNQERVLENVYDCLKPGGTFLLGFSLQSLLSCEICRFGQTVHSWLRNHPIWSSYFTKSVRVDLRRQWESKDMFTETMSSIGFTILKAELLPNNWVSWNDALVKAHLKILLPHARHVPREMREDLLGDVSEYLYTASPKRADGRVQGEIGPYDYLILVATK